MTGWAVGDTRGVAMVMGAFVGFIIKEFIKRTSWFRRLDAKLNAKYER